MVTCYSSNAEGNIKYREENSAIRQGILNDFNKIIAAHF